jgi:undecaprenyl-diphosphatase
MTVLGLVQGISEVLPISSSVNLYLFSKLCFVHDFSFSTKIALHAGSLIALLIFFNDDIHDILLGLFSNKKRLADTYFFQLVLGTIPVVITGLFARDYVMKFDSAIIMGVTSIIFGCLLVVFDKISPSTRTKSNVSMLGALIIGCFQSISIIPGVSRLGICITGARMVSMPRKKALNFSLLLAIPSILGSITLEILDMYEHAQISVSSGAFWGILTTAIVGLLFIRMSIRFMEKHGFFMIAIYRVVIGILICFV